MRKVATLGWGIGALCDLVCALVCLGIGKIPSMCIYFGAAIVAGGLASISYIKETYGV